MGFFGAIVEGGLFKVFTGLFISFIVNSFAMWFVMNYITGNKGDGPFKKCVMACGFLTGVALLAFLFLFYSPVFSLTGFLAIYIGGSIAVVQGVFELTEGGMGILVCYLLVSMFVQMAIPKVTGKKSPEQEYAAAYNKPEAVAERQQYRYESFRDRMGEYLDPGLAVDVDFEKDWSRATVHREKDGKEFAFDLKEQVDEGKTPYEAVQKIRVDLADPDIAKKSPAKPKAVAVSTGDSGLDSLLAGGVTPSPTPVGGKNSSAGSGTSASPGAASSTASRSGSAAKSAPEVTVFGTTPVATATPAAPSTASQPAAATSASAPAPATATAGKAKPEVTVFGTTPVSTPTPAATPVIPAPWLGGTPRATPAAPAADLAPADALLRQATKDWGEQHYERSITNAESALAIYRRVLGEDAPKVAEVKKMVESAKKMAQEQKKN